MINQNASTTHLLKWGIVLAGGFLIIASVYTSLLIMQRQSMLKEVSRYNATWLVSQAAIEVTRLTASLAAFGDEQAGVTVEEVQLRLDIVMNRAKILSDGDPAQYIQSRIDLRVTLLELERAIRLSLPLIDALQPNVSTIDVYLSFAPLVAKLNRLAASVHERNAESATNDLNELTALSRLFSGLLVCLIICGFGLVVFGRWNYTLLQTAHTKVKDLADSLFVQNSRFDAALNNMPQGLSMGTSDGTVVVFNASFAALFGKSGTTISRERVEDLYDGSPDTSKMPRALTRQVALKHIGLIAAGVPAKVLQEGSGRSLALTHEPMSTGGWVTTYEDVTEQREAEARMSFMANHDMLTGLPNRTYFRHQLGDAISGLRDGISRSVVLCLDLALLIHRMSGILWRVSLKLLILFSDWVSKPSIHAIMLSHTRHGPLYN